MKDWKFRIMKFFYILIIVTALTISVTYCIHWFLRAFFDITVDVSFGAVIFVTGITCWLLMALEIPQYEGEKNTRNMFDAKLRAYDLRIRHLLRLLFFRLSIIMTLGSVTYGILLGVADEPQPSFLLVFMAGLFMMWFSPFIISIEDIALIYFKKFKDENYNKAENLEKGLNRYNMSVNYNFSTKKLSRIVQYVNYAYILELEECKNSIRDRVNELISSLEKREMGQIPDILVKFSKDCDKMLEKYHDIGLEIKVNKFNKAKEVVFSTLQKVLPQLFWLIILIVIYLVLETFIPIDFPFLG